MKKKVMIVDDEHKLLKLAERILQDKYDVVCVKDGDVALDSFIREEPDAVLLDLELKSVLQGKDLLKLFREKKLSLPIAIVSGSGDSKEELTLLGADKIIAKPYLPSTIIDFLESNLEIAKVDEE